MRHAVILAHPAPDSLNRLIATTYIEAVRGQGQVAWRSPSTRVGLAAQGIVLQDSTQGTTWMKA